MSAAFIFCLVALAATLATLAIRDHRKSVSRRLSLLDQARGLLDNDAWSAGEDGFPGLEGTRDGRSATIKLIPDTMVMRRLPQLWLSVTLRQSNAKLPAVSVLTRHSGNEFYAATMDMPVRLDAPDGWPMEVIVRGNGPASQALCTHLGPELARILADPRVKEVTLADRGVRILRQASEGRRGEHLLLRQAVFDMEEVARADVEQTLNEAETLLARAAAFRRDIAA